MSNPQSVSYKETATYHLAATRTWCQRLNSNQLQPGYESCAISTSASLANLARAEGFEPPSSALETDSLTLSLRPRFQMNCQRAIKNPALGRVRCIKTNTLRPSTHDSPNDPLGHSGYAVFYGLLHKSHSRVTEYRSYLLVAIRLFPYNLVLEHLAGLEPA